MKLVSDKNYLPAEQIKTYDEMDGLLIIEQLLLYKGEEIGSRDNQKRRIVHIGLLEEMAHIVYGLQANKTNKLYVGYYLNRIYRHTDLICHDSPALHDWIRIPDEIYEKVKEINNKFRKAD